MLSIIQKWLKKKIFGEAPKNTTKTPNTKTEVLENCVQFLPGYEDVSDLIPNGDLRPFGYVWSFSYSYYLDASFTLKTRFTIDLVRDLINPIDPFLRIVCDEPTKIGYPDHPRILGLEIYDIHDRGWEKGRYHLYDYEHSGLMLYSSNIRLIRLSFNPYA